MSDKTIQVEVQDHDTADKISREFVDVSEFDAVDDAIVGSLLVLRSIHPRGTIVVGQLVGKHHEDLEGKYALLFPDGVDAAMDAIGTDFMEICEGYAIVGREVVDALKADGRTVKLTKITLPELPE
jgi:hypothetical protein